jgi:hypothetical protein
MASASTLAPLPAPLPQQITQLRLLLARIEHAAMVAFPVCPLCFRVIRKGDAVTSDGTRHLNLCSEDDMERSRR